VKSKVAVDSYDDRIDPVGACVGMKGSRIHGIVRELKKILMLLIIDNIQLYMSIKPKISSIKINEETKELRYFEIRSF
jgi:N utilization substance protein A